MSQADPASNGAATTDRCIRNAADTERAAPTGGAPTDAASNGSVPAISVHGLTKTYGEIEAVRGIDFEVARGETFGFLGPNGAGKSTTISMLCTLARPTGGSARVAGMDVVSERDSVRRNIGLVFQDTTLDNYLSAEQNLRLHAELYGMPREAIAPRMQSVLEMLQLWERRESLVGTFSGGMKRRLEIARGLLALAPRAVPGRADDRPRPADAQLDLVLHHETRRRAGRHDLPHHPLHGRGRVLRPHRDHRPRQDRGARHARGLEGKRRQGPRADHDRRR